MNSRGNLCNNAKGPIKMKHLKIDWPIGRLVLSLCLLIGGIWFVLELRGCGNMEPAKDSEGEMHCYHTVARARSEEAGSNGDSSPADKCLDFFHGAFGSEWQDYYSKILTAGHEGRLKAGTEMGAFQYRFIWARSSDPPWIFHLEEKPNGKYTITAKKLNAAGSEFEYAVAYTLESVTTLNVAKDKVYELREMIDQIGFWGMAPSNNQVGMDGSAWVIEGLVGSKYHAVHRQSPMDDAENDFEKLGRWFMQAGGMKIPTDPDEYY